MEKNKPTELKPIDQYSVDELLVEMGKKSAQDGSTAAKEAVRMLLDVKGFSIDSKPRADGRWQGRVMVEGKQKSIYGRTEKEVIEKLQKFVVMGRMPEKPKPKQPPKTKTVKEWLDQYLSVFKPNSRPATQKDHMRYADRICAVFGETPVNKLDTVSLASYFNDMAGSRQRQLVFMFFNAAMKKAVKIKLVKENPLDEIEIAKHRREERSPLTREQQEIFEAAIKGTRHELRLLTMLEAGLRPAEAAAITHADFDHENKCVIINKSVAEDGATKTENSDRIAPLTAKLSAAAKSLDLAPATGKNLYRAAKKAFDTNGWDDLTLYSLRHTCATNWDEQGVPERISAIWLGNSPEVLRKHYIHKRDAYEQSLWEKVVFDTTFDTKNAPK